MLSYVSWPRELGLIGLKQSFYPISLVTEISSKADMKPSQGNAIWEDIFKGFW